MKLYPTSGQTSSNMVHSARLLTISASSFASNGYSGAANDLGERKKNLLQRSSRDPGLPAQLIEGSNPPHLPSGEKDKTVTNPLGIGQLMNGENERAPLGGFAADHFNDVAGLPKVEAIEWLVHEQHVLRRQETKRQHQPAGVAL